MRDLMGELRGICGDTFVKRDEPMSRHTTFRAGGPARYFAVARDEEALRSLVTLCGENRVPFYLLGNGSNLLVSDEGYDGVIIQMGEGLSRVEDVAPGQGQEAAQAVPEPEPIRYLLAGAGALLSKISREALARSLTGFEFASGIPGSLGGAVVMNAGAYGDEMKDVLVSARTLGRNGEVSVISVDELNLGYRHSCVMDRGLIVLSAVLRLRPGDPAEIRARMEELAQKRKEKQPLEFPSAGSTFKRPAGHFAGKLIEEAGLRGFRVGDAQVSEKHCGFVINRGNATAAEIRALIREVQKRVRESSGVDLETEVKFIGWSE